MTSLPAQSYRTSKGLWQVEDDVWLISFMDYDMAYFNMESHKVSALEIPFDPKYWGELQL